MAWYRQNLSINKSEHIKYAEFLLSGEKYSISISKKYLFRIFMPFWIVLYVLFAVRHKFFFYWIILPNLFFYSLFSYMVYPVWRMCNISPKAYIVFHCCVLILLKLLAIPFGYLVEALWTLCF